MNKIERFIEIVDLPTKAELLNQGDRDELFEYRVLRTRLEELVDIEKELGIDVITFFKALKYGVCIKNRSGQIYRTPVRLYWNNLTRNEFVLSLSFRTEEGIILRFEDYGKMWALTKEELE